MEEKKKSEVLQLLLRTVVKKPDGTVIHDSGARPSRSLVIQFLEFIYGLSGGAGNTLQATDYNGAENYIYQYNLDTIFEFQINGGINDYRRGIVVGTGDTAVDNEDYKLETQLTEGVGAGNITHGAMVFVPTEVVGANVEFVMKRSFVNNTGSTITAKEAGAYIKGSSSNYFFCVIRDVLPSAIDIPDKCSLTVYYYWRTAV